MLDQEPGSLQGQKVRCQNGVKAVDYRLKEIDSRDADYNIAKISHDGRKVSFLRYKDFDRDAHPELLHSVRVHLPTASYTIRDYSESSNPPILHRKETFVDPLYQNFSTFADLTRQEEELDLLSRPNIGFRTDWLQFLAERGLQIVDHTVVSASPSQGSIQQSEAD